MEKESCLLKKVEKQELDAKEFGFYWENIDQLLEQVRSECLEVKEAADMGKAYHLQEEIGDLIQAAIGVAVFCDFDPHTTLQKSIDKFQKRYDKVVELVKKDGLTHLQKEPFEILMKYWDQAKIETKS